MVAHITENNRHHVIKTCDCCGIRYDLYICYEDLFAWQNREGFIQDLMPYLTDGERELIMTGTCGTCFDLMFDALEENEA